MTYTGADPARDGNWSPARLIVIALLVTWLFSGVAAAEPTKTANKAAKDATVTEVVDGDTVVLDSGDQVRLVGIQAPKLPLGRPNFRKWPLADDAKAALSTLAKGRKVRLTYGGRRVDRWGRLLAHLYGPGGQWIQGELLKRGMARVYSFADNRAKIAEMLALERTARKARKGIWDHPYYQIRTADDAARHTNSFQLVEGRVLQVAQVRGRAFLNFGRDWRKDFTISLTSRAVRTFEKAGRPPRDYEGKRIRVRGWLKWRNGPAISATHPEQIEVLDK